MTIGPNRASSDPHPFYEGNPQFDEQGGDERPLFDQLSWSETRDELETSSAGGRVVLGWSLAILALLWTAYTAWSAGRFLAEEPLTSPALAQWIAILAGPLALMGLVWLMFGRTRRKEAERFTRSVIAMRTEARALQDVLAAMSRQIGQSHSELGQVAGDLMGLGDEAATRLGAVTADLNQGSQRLAEHGAALDRAAEAARTDIGVLLADLPQAEESARRMAETLREAGRSATEQAANFEGQVRTLSAETRQADEAVSQASAQLLSNLAQIEAAGAAAATRLSETGTESRASIEALLAQSAEALAEIRTGVDAQAAAVAALVSQSQAGIGRAGIEASEQLGERLSTARAALDGLSARIAEQERTAQQMVAALDSGIASLDERFLTFAQSGVARLRGELDLLIETTSTHDAGIGGMADRMTALRQGVDQLGDLLQGEVARQIGEAEAGTGRLLASAEEARPHVEAIRDAAVEAANRIESGASGVGQQQEQLAALMTSVDLGVSQAEQRLAELSASIMAAGEEAGRLSNETGPSLVAALVQVREAAGHAAERAREAIGKVIPESAGKLSVAARTALEAAIREGVEEKLVELDQVATRAVETAREASDRLTAQMLSIGQSAAALEAHIERNREAQRKDSGEEFAKRVSLLMDSMNSAAIDVQKVLSDEVDEKAWASYLKGNRGVFTRRAVRLLGGSEVRAIAAHAESDPEFEGSVNRYVHDFEAMLRRVLAERDGGMIAVTLMSSDMGKLYAALAQAVERGR